MDALDHANHRTLHDTPGMDAQEIARRMVKSYQVLLNKVNWACDGNQLTQREAIGLQLTTGTRDIIRAECRLLGGEFVPHEPVAVSDLPSAILSAAAEHGDVARAIRDALGDNMLSTREVAAIQKQIDEAVDSLHSLGRAVKSRDSGVVT